MSPLIPVLCVVFAFLLGVALPAAAATVTHVMATQQTLGGHRITSTVTADVAARVDWEFIQLLDHDNGLGSTAVAYTSKKAASVTASHTVPCPAGAGTWQVHVQVHRGARGVGTLLFSDTQLVQLSCG